MNEVNFDPRTKLILLVFCVLCTVLAPSLNYELVLVILVALFGLVLKRYWYVLFGLTFYFIIFILTNLSVYNLTGVWQAIMVSFFGLVNKVYPCGFMGGIVISTTKTSEFMAALYKIHIPDSFVIPFAVMMRYLPVVKEDWSFIKDGMKMRDISPSLKGLITHPAMTAECLYVPMMMAASKTADELSIAAVTRGIENPNPRTCLTKIGFSAKDGLAVCFILIYFIMGLAIRRSLI